jgi:hypothetical protein
VGIKGSFLDEAIKVDSGEIFKILLTVGADSRKINVEALTPEFKQIYTENAVVPDADNPNSVELERNITSIVDDIAVFYDKLGPVIERASSYDFKENQITPAINTQNAVITTFSKFFKRIDTAGKMIFTSRIALIANQIGFIASKERNELEEIFNQDEGLWSDLINESKPKLTSNIETLDRETSAEIENLLLVFSKKKSHVFKAIKIPDESDLNTNRARLAYANIQLVRFYEIVRKAFAAFESFKPSVYLTFDKAIKALGEFQETLDVIRNSNAEIILDKENAEKEAELQTRELADLQAARMQIDITYLRWLETQFTELCEITDQCLRMCL